MSEYSPGSSQGAQELPSALVETYNTLQQTLATIDQGVSTLHEAGHQLEVSVDEHAEATAGSSHGDNVKTITLRQEVAAGLHEHVSRLYLAASLIGHAANALHGMPEAVASSPASNTDESDTGGDSGKDWVIRSRDKIKSTEEWHNVPLLSDPAQIHHPTKIAEHPNGGLEVTVHGNEDITVMGTIRPNGNVQLDDIISDRNHSQPAQAVEAVRTFVREAARRGAYTVTGAIENIGVAHGVIRNCGIESVMLNGQPTTANEIRDAVREGGANISIDLDDRKVKKFLEQPHYR